MRMPDELKVQIEIALKGLNQNPLQGLKPYERIKLYDAFGPTFAPADASGRVKHLNVGKFTFTKADFARAWASILTAKQFLPLWEEAWANWEQKTDTDDQEDDANLEDEETPDVYSVSTRKLPYYLLELGEGVLKGLIGVEKAWHEANEAHYIVGISGEIPGKILL